MSEWFEDEEFWRIFGDCMFRREQFEAADGEIASLLDLADRPVGRALDLGCGPGRHALALARLGVTVTGVDRTGCLLSGARERAEAAGLAVEWVQADMRTFSRPGAFDLVLSMWTSFGYFDDPDDDREVLRRCFENLAPGGTLVVDVAGQEIIVRDLEPVHLTEYDDGRLLVERPLLDREMTRYHNEWLLIDGDRVHRAHWHQNLYSGRELAGMLAEAGFGELAIYGGIDGRDYDLAADRLVVLGRRARESAAQDAPRRARPHP